MDRIAALPDFVISMKVRGPPNALKLLFTFTRPLSSRISRLLLDELFEVSTARKRSENVIRSAAKSASVIPTLVGLERGPVEVS